MSIFIKKCFLISLIALLLLGATAESIFTIVVPANYELCEESESSVEINEFVAGRNKLVPKKVEVRKPTAANLFLRSPQSSTHRPQSIFLKEDKHILFRTLLI
jgi:hypothetical protein